MVANTFFYLFFPYGISDYRLIINGPQFVAEFSTSSSLPHRPHTRPLKATAFRPMSRPSAINITLVTRLCHYVFEHEPNWDQFVQPLMYAHNAQFYTSMDTYPFALTLSQHPPSPVFSAPGTEDLTDSERPFPRSIHVGLFNKLRHVFVNSKNCRSCLNGPTRSN